MDKIILFQGPLISTGRSFSQIIESRDKIKYHCLEKLLHLSNKLKEKRFKCFYLFWKKEAESFENNTLFKKISPTEIVLVPHINFPRGKLKNNLTQRSKLLHYYAMSFGIEYLLSNDLVKSEDIIFRSRTDITFDCDEFAKLISTNLSDLSDGKTLCQYWRKENPRWFYDFLFGSNITVMFSLYNHLYLNCINNNDYAFSVHQDIIKTLATIYLPEYLILKEGPPKIVSKKSTIKFIKSKVNLSENNFPDIIFARIFIQITKFTIIQVFYLNKFLFYCYTKYEKLILYFVYKCFINTMSFKFQSSIFWRGHKCTDDYETFKRNSNLNQTLIFSDIKK